MYFSRVRDQNHVPTPSSCEVMAKFHYLQVLPPGSNFGSPDAPRNINQLRKNFTVLIFYQNATL